MRSKAKLESFVAYCTANPEERFWQALRNWSKYAFIYGQKGNGMFVTSAMDMRGNIVRLEDTFYAE